MILISQVPNILQCWYNEKGNYTQHDWQSFFCDYLEGQQKRAALEAFLDTVKAKKVTKHVVNVKDCKDAFREEDLDYITNYLVPKEIEYGIRYLANIVADDLITQVATEFWQEKVEGDLMVRNFASLAEALDWLKNK